MRLRFLLLLGLVSVLFQGCGSNPQTPPIEKNDPETLQNSKDKPEETKALHAPSGEVKKANTGIFQRIRAKLWFKSKKSQPVI
jgi:hypothetical protein